MTQYTADQILAALKGRSILTRDGTEVILTSFSTLPGVTFSIRGVLPNEDRENEETWTVTGAYTDDQPHPHDIDIDYYMGLAGCRRPVPEPSRLRLTKEAKDGLTASLDVAINLMAAEVTNVFKAYGSLDDMKVLLDHRANLNDIKKLLEALS